MSGSPGYALGPTDTVYVAGHRGMVGSALWRALSDRGIDRLVGVPSTELDLRDTAAVEQFYCSSWDPAASTLGSPPSRSGRTP